MWAVERRACGLPWGLVRSIQRAQSGKQEQVLENGHIGKRNRDEWRYGKKKNPKARCHFLYILWWRNWGAPIFNTPFTVFGCSFFLCAFDNVVVNFLSSLLLEAAGPPLCWSTHSLLPSSLARHLQVHCHGHSHLVSLVTPLHLSTLHLSPPWQTLLEIGSHFTFALSHVRVSPYGPGRKKMN